jgi:peptide/nickel transport system ATP-binding protein
MNRNVLAIRGLTVSFSQGPFILRAIDRLNLDLGEGEILGVIGESGSGKTTLCRAIIGMCEGKVEGEIIFEGQNLVGLGKDKMKMLRWNRISLCPTSTVEVFNPSHRIVEQITEPLKEHKLMSSSDAARHANNLLIDCGLSENHGRRYPHQLAGGERQRALIAMALAGDPDIVLLDEPTTAIDVSTKNVIVNLLLKMLADKTAIVVSHDISLIESLCSRIAVLYAGQVVEVAPTAALLAQPRHPYTNALLNTYPDMNTTKDLRQIRGSLPTPGEDNRGCRYFGRCTQAVEICSRQRPELKKMPDGQWQLACHRGGLIDLISATGLSKTFYINTGLLNTEHVRAVDEVDIRIREGEIVALVGESGSGKTTTAKMLMGLLPRDSGRVLFEGEPLWEDKATKDAMLAMRRRIQVIYQDPYEAISQRFTVLEVVQEPLVAQHIGSEGYRKEVVRTVLKEVGLPNDDYSLEKYPFQLSGGELQRVSIARALVLDPKVIIADEPTALLDSSIQAKIMKLLMELQINRGTGMLLITHNLALARKVADTIYVMLRGHIVEKGKSSDVISHPLHPYTRQLLRSARGEDMLTAIRSDAGHGCPFAHRCECFRHRGDGICQHCLSGLKPLTAISSHCSSCSCWWHQGGFHVTERSESTTEEEEYERMQA